MTLLRMSPIQNSNLHFYLYKHKLYMTRWSLGFPLRGSGHANEMREKDPPHTLTQQKSNMWKLFKNCVCFLRGSKFMDTHIVSNFSSTFQVSSLRKSLAWFNPMSYLSTQSNKSNSRVVVSIADNRASPQELQHYLKFMMIQCDIHREIAPAESCPVLRIKKVHWQSSFIPCNHTHSNSKGSLLRISSHVLEKLPALC